MFCKLKCLPLGYMILISGIFQICMSAPYRTLVEQFEEIEKIIPPGEGLGGSTQTAAGSSRRESVWPSDNSCHPDTNQENHDPGSTFRPSATERKRTEKRPSNAESTSGSSRPSIATWDDPSQRGQKRSREQSPRSGRFRVKQERPAPTRKPSGRGFNVKVWLLDPWRKLFGKLFSFFRPAGRAVLRRPTSLLLRAGFLATWPAFILGFPGRGFMCSCH